MFHSNSEILKKESTFKQMNFRSLSVFWFHTEKKSNTPALHFIVELLQAIVSILIKSTPVDLGVMIQKYRELCFSYLKWDHYSDFCDSMNLILLGSSHKKNLLSGCLNHVLAYHYYFIDLSTVDSRPIHWHPSSLFDQIYNSTIFKHFKTVQEWSILLFIK